MLIDYVKYILLYAWLKLPYLNPSLFASLGKFHVSVSSNNSFKDMH